MKKFIIGLTLTLFFVGCGLVKTEPVHTDSTCVKADSVKVDSAKAVVVDTLKKAKK
jgi:hypothetical protein